MNCVRMALLAMVIAGTALAEEERPHLQPTRDVDVTYRVTRPNEPSTAQRVRWSAASHRERVDGSDGSATIIDRDADEITLIAPKSRTYRNLEGQARGAIEIGSDVALTRGDETTVAGLRCINWSWQEAGETRTVCATPDGVPLRLVVGGATVKEARAVTYREQKPELFEVPPGYTPALAPEGGPAP
jgi:hypothetical protein